MGRLICVNTIAEIVQRVYSIGLVCLLSKNRDNKTKFKFFFLVLKAFPCKYVIVHVLIVINLTIECHVCLHFLHFVDFYQLPNFVSNIDCFVKRYNQINGISSTLFQSC